MEESKNLPRLPCHPDFLLEPALSLGRNILTTEGAPEGSRYSKFLYRPSFPTDASVSDIS